MSSPNWLVLLIGGPSGVGKSVVARQLGRQFSISWLQVDDVRLAFQRSHVTLPEKTSELYFFEETPHIWRLPPERLRDGLIAVGQIMMPALEIVIENHVDTLAPIIIEGDGILPALLARPAVRDRAIDGQMRAIFLIESEESAMLANIEVRRQGISDDVMWRRGNPEQTGEEVRTEARAKWLYGQWLADEARRQGLPVLEPRPWSTLIQRMMESF